MLQTSAGDSTSIPIDSFIESFLETSGTATASIAILGVVTLLFMAVRLTHRQRRIRFEIKGPGTKETPDEVARLQYRFGYRLHRLIVDLQNLFDVLPPLWTETIYSFRFDRSVALRTQELATLEVKVGPVSTSKIDRLLGWVRKESVVTILIVPQGQEASVFAIAGGRTTVQKTIRWNAADSELDEVFTESLGMLTSKGGFSDALLLKGIREMARFFQPPFQVDSLKIAAIYLDEAASTSADKLAAQMLALYAGQLSKETPQRISERVTAASSAWHGRGRRVARTLKYQEGLAQFYTYQVQGYREAIKAFKEVQKRQNYHGLLATMGLKRARETVLMDLLAKANEGIAYAHMIGHNSPADGDVENMALSLAVGVKESLSGSGKRWLGKAEKEVRWRYLNILISTANHQGVEIDEGDLYRAISQAHEALGLAPYALDVKANLGRLFLQMAFKSPVAQGEWIRRAHGIFLDLEETGWDPGYIHFRLGVTNRILGDFQSALEHLERARQPEIRDVSMNKIMVQNTKATASDSTLSLEDL